ncbi:S41 family peptidase [Spirosoma knui]
MIRSAFFTLAYTLFVCFWLVAQPKKADVDPLRKIPVAALRADFQFMRQVLEELHPGLYQYTPKGSLNTVFDRAYASIKRPMTETEFMNLLYPVIRQIRCGHTQLEHSTAYRQSPNRPKAVHLPFDVFVQGNRAWIVSNQSTDSTLRVGDELLRINGVMSADLIQAGINSWNGDGYNLTWNEFFLNEYDFFEDVCGTIYGWKGPYTLQIRDLNGSVRTLNITVPTKPVITPKPTLEQSPAEAEKLAQEQAEVHKRSYLDVRFMPDSATAILSVNGLEYGDEAFYEQAFQQIDKKQIKHLVLDIRRNHGGDARIINKLLSYLADSSYVFLQRVTAKVANPGKNRFSAHFDPELTRSYFATFKPGRRIGTEYEFEFSPEMGKLTGYQPVAQAYRFRGNVYVLIDGGTFSNGANFAAALKAQCRKAVFIGRETGGTELGCGGGTNNKLTLPHSKLVLQFPWMRLVSASRNTVDGHGLQPDYPVRNTPQSVATRNDLDLAKALALIEQHQLMNK